MLTGRFIATAGMIACVAVDDTRPFWGLGRGEAALHQGDD